jgi:hypothetical protein
VLADVRDEAARQEQRTIVNKIMFLPHRVCRGAEKWDAPDLVGQCTLYHPQSYGIADRYDSLNGGIAALLRETVQPSSREPSCARASSARRPSESVASARAEDIRGSNLEATDYSSGQQSITPTTRNAAVLAA